MSGEGDEFTCAFCAGTFRKGWSDEEAMQKCIADGFDKEPTVLVCEYCYREIVEGCAARPEHIGHA